MFHVMIQPTEKSLKKVGKEVKHKKANDEFHYFKALSFLASLLCSLNLYLPHYKLLTIYFSTGFCFIASQRLTQSVVQNKLDTS